MCCTLIPGSHRTLKNVIEGEGEKSNMDRIFLAPSSARGFLLERGDRGPRADVVLEGTMSVAGMR